MHDDAATASQLELLTNEKMELIGENENLRRRIKQLQEQVAKPSGLRLDKAFMSKKKKTLQEDVVLLTEEVEDLKCKLQSEAEQKGALQQNLKFLQQAYQEAKQELESFRKAAENTGLETKACQEKLLAEQRTIQAAMEALNVEHQKLQRRQAETEKELHMAQRELELRPLAGDGESSLGAVGDAGKGIRAMLQENYDLAQRVQQLSEELKGHKADEEATLQCYAIEMGRLAANHSLALYEHFQATQENQSADICAVILNHSEELKEFQEELTVCSMENADLKLQLARRTAELNDAKKELEEMSIQLSASLESLAHMQQKAEHLMDDVSTCEWLRRENQALSAQVTRLQENLQEKGRQLEATCTSLMEAEAALAKKSSLLKQHDEQVKQLQHRAEQAEAETMRRHMTETAIRRQMDELRGEMSGMKGATEAHLMDATNLSMQLDSLQASFQDTQGRLHYESTELAKVVAAKQQLDIEVDMLSSELCIAKAQHDETACALQASQQKNSELHTTIVALEDQLRQTEADFTEVGVVGHMLLQLERDQAEYRCSELEVECRRARNLAMHAMEQQETHRAHIEDLQKQAEIDTRKQYMFIRELQAQLAAATASIPAVSSQSTETRGHRRVQSCNSHCSQESSPLHLSPDGSASESRNAAAQPNIWVESSVPSAQSSPSTVPDKVSEEELVLLDRVTRLQMTNWEMEERLKGAEMQVQKLQESIVRKDEVLQHWIAQRPMTQDPPKRRLKFLPTKTSATKQATQLQMQTLVEQTTIQNLICEEQIAELQSQLQTLLAHHQQCGVVSGPPTSQPSAMLRSRSFTPKASHF